MSPVPPRPSPGDYEALEAALGPRHRAALDAVCETLGVRRDRWQEVPALHWTFVTVAVVRLASELRGDGSARAAIERAAIRLDIPPDTVLNRLRCL